MIDSTIARGSARPRSLGVRDRARAIPAAAWLTALVGLLSAMAWALLTPPFMVPDEESHYAYAERLVEAGRPPQEEPLVVRSAEQEALRRALKLDSTAGQPGNAGVWSAVEARGVRDVRDAGLGRDGNGHSFGATPQPPLYYALETVPYRLGGGDPLQRLQLMRFLSALLMGLTVALVFLFLRELLPGAPWTWTVGALGIALHPLVGFVGGGVNPDALLCASAAALFLCVVRALRRGLTLRLALVTGAVLGVGAIGKLNLLGLLPAVLLALLIAARSVEQQRGLRALRLPAVALAVACVPVAVTALLNVAVWDRPAIGLIAAGADRLGGGSIGDRLAYAWQLYLPPLPGMTDVFGYSTTRWLWWRGYVGWFGPVDTTFPDRVYAIALVPAGIVSALALRALMLSRASVRRRLPELSVYAVAVAGMLGLIAAQSWATDAVFDLTGSGGQTRYLFPLLPLYGALLALAARGAGPRWGRVAGIAIVGVALGHDLASQLLVVGRFYA